MAPPNIDLGNIWGPWRENSLEREKPWPLVQFESKLDEAWKSQPEAREERPVVVVEGPVGRRELLEEGAAQRPFKA